MTAYSLNPFPDYAVTRLAPAEATQASTVVTPAIGRARNLVARYIEGVRSASLLNSEESNAPSTGSPEHSNAQYRTNAALCAVRGDYGTGKTHLLNDAAAHVQALSGTSLQSSILRATCIEADPLLWYRTKIGPQLDALPLYDIAIELFGRAGQRVAAATPLTESAAEVLEREPKRVRDLVRSNHLSIDEISREYQRQLDTICADYDPYVRKVLSFLVSSETDAPARAWLRGGTLSSHDAELLTVPPTMQSAEQASSAIAAIAAIHNAVGHPFVILVDELEHFVRYDRSQQSWGNVTWLKRLLEELGSAGALAFVAGHWSAWETTKDYLDRFPQHAPIDLVKLEAADIEQLLQARLGRLPPGFDLTQAQIIVNVTSGNMRRVVTLCNLLFRRTDGFTTALTGRQIHEAWTSVAQRTSQEQALEQVMNLLTARGFDVKSSDARVRSIPFDLVATRHDGGMVVVQAKHAASHDDQYDAATQFIEKFASIAQETSRTIGVFLSNGSIDDELLGILSASGFPNLRWFDLTDREVMRKIKEEIDVLYGALELRAPQGTVAATTQTHSSAVQSNMPDIEAEKLRAVKAELEKQLRELNERRAQEALELNERLERLAQAVASPRLESVREQAQISPDRARAAYEAMLEKPGANQKLRLLGWHLIACLGLIALSVFMLLAQPYYGSGGNFAYALFTIIALPVAGIAIVWWRYSQVIDYFDFSHRLIRDLYVRDAPIETLSRVNATLRRSIDRYGVSRARRRAIRDLLDSPDMTPMVRDYLRDIIH